MVKAAEYHPDPAAIDSLRAVKRAIRIDVFFGSWCWVCAQRLPMFLKILETAANPNIKTRFVAISEDFKQPADEVTSNAIRITPTFIIREDGKEVGRIDKRPQVSLEADLVRILSAATPTPH